MGQGGNRLENLGSAVKILKIELPDRQRKGRGGGEEKKKCRPEKNPHGCQIPEKKGGNKRKKKMERLNHGGTQGRRDTWYKKGTKKRDG